MFYLLHGEDEFSRAETLAHLKEKAGEPTVVELNTTVLDGRKITLPELKGACDALPFMSERRLVIVEGLLTWLAEGEGKGKLPKAKQEFLKGLLEYLPQVPPSTRLIFVESTTIKPDHPVYRLAQAEEAYIKEFPLLKGEKLAQWVRQRVKSKGGEISPAALQTLVTFVGNDLRLLNQEIEKLLTYLGRARPIEEEDVRLLVSYVQEADIFEMVDALGQRNSSLALKLLHKLLEGGSAPLALLGMISRQFRILIQVKELEEEGLSLSAIAQKLGLHQFVVQKVARQARNFAMEQLERAYDCILETDWAIKTGRLEPVLALDILLIRLGGAGPALKLPV